MKFEKKGNRKNQKIGNPKPAQTLLQPSSLPFLLSPGPERSRATQHPPLLSRGQPSRMAPAQLQRSEPPARTSTAKASPPGIHTAPPLLHVSAPFGLCHRRPRGPAASLPPHVTPAHLSQQLTPRAQHLGPTRQPRSLPADARSGSTSDTTPCSLGPTVGDQWTHANGCAARAYLLPHRPNTWQSSKAQHGRSHASSHPPFPF